MFSNIEPIDDGEVSWRWQSAGARRVRCLGPDGVYHAWQLRGGASPLPGEPIPSDEDWGQIVDPSLVEPSAAKLQEFAAGEAVRTAARTQEQNRAQAIANALIKLDNGTATLADLRQYMAALIRFVRAEQRRD